MKSKSLFALGMLLLLPLAAEAGNIPVTLYNNDGGVPDVSSALDFNVSSVDSNTVRFTFKWDATELGNLGYSAVTNYGNIRIDQFAVVDGIFVEPVSEVSVTGDDFHFIQRVGEDVQGAGELFNHPLIKNLVTFELQEDSKSGNLGTTLDAGDADALVIDLDLKSGITFDDVQTAIADGTVRIGVHVISNGEGSQVYVSGPESEPGPTIVPEPASMILLAFGGLGLLACRRRNKSNAMAA